MSSRRQKAGTAVRATGTTRPSTPSPSDDDGLVAGDDNPCVGDPDYDYSGGVCGECGSGLTCDGRCGNRRCVYADFYQDEIVPAAVRREKQQVVGNPRSRRAYLWGTRGYRRVVGSGHAVVFRDESEADAAGYEVRDD